MVKVGDRVQIPIEVLDDPSRKNGKITMRTGIVVFVSKKGLFHTVAVAFGENILRYTVDGV